MKFNCLENKKSKIPNVWHKQDFGYDLNGCHEKVGLMKKILVFTSLFGEPFFGGAEATVFEYYKSLAEEPYQIVVCTLDKKYSNKFYQEFSNLHLKRFSTRLPHPVMERNQTNFVIKAFLHILNMSIGLRPLTVAKEFRRLKPNLVITHNLSGWGMFPWIMCRAMRIPLVHDNHDFYLKCFKTTMWKSKQGVCKKTCKSCIPRSFATKFFWGGGLMLTNSLFLQKSIRQVLTRQVHTDYEIIYPPVKISRQSIKSSEIRYDAVFIGRLEESKGINAIYMYYLLNKMYYYKKHFSQYYCESN